jgi:hypothetical protein
MCSSFSFSVTFMGKFNKRLVKYLIAASLYYRLWHESFGMTTSVAVGFLYIMNCKLLLSLVFVLSKKVDFIFRPFCHSKLHRICQIVKCF